MSKLYQYRHGAIHEIKDILQNAKDSRREHLPKQQELYFEPLSIHYLCAELLEVAQIPNNPHLLQALHQKYVQTQTESTEKLLFSLEEVFSDGWLRRTAEEWLWNNNPYEYKRLTSYRDPKEEQIVKFLQSLRETPYKDGLYPHICEDDIRFTNLLKATGVSVDWLIEKNLLIKKENALYINTFSHEWETYGEYVLSKKYEDWNCAEHPENIKKWIHCCEFFTRCWNPDKYINTKDALLRYCIEQLEQEESSWLQETILVTRAMKVSSNRLNDTYEFFVPPYGAERQKFITIYFERWCRLEETHSRRNIYYGICTNNYLILGPELQQRFRKILKKPCFEIQYFHLTHWENLNCTADCLDEADLFIPAVCNIFRHIINNHQKDEVKNLYIKQLVKPIWDICYNSLHQISKKEWAKNLAELLAYLYDEGDFYRNNVRPKFFANSYAEFLSQILQFYFTETSDYSNPDGELISYLLERLRNTNDHSIQKYLGILMCLGKYGQLHSNSINRKHGIFDGVFQGLEIWIQLAKEKDLLLSTTSWNFFSETVWHEVLVQIQENLIGFFDTLSIQELKKSKLYNQEKSAILGVGQLALLGLYFRALCLTELQDKFSKQIMNAVENGFVNEFTSCQNQWRLFSGENIRLGASSIVLSKCMHALSFLSETNRKAFIETLNMDAIIDVAFWLEYVRNQYIRNQLLSVLIAVPKETLFNNIYFFPTWQHAVDNLLNLCFDESENEAQSNPIIEKILEFVEYTLIDFGNVLSNKPESVRKDYKEWQESASCRIMLLKNQTEELLSSEHDFYKGIVWLNSNQLEDVQKAKAIYAQLREGSVSCQSNYLIACVLEITKKKELGLDYRSELHNYEIEFSNHITASSKIFSQELYPCYLYGLYLYLSLGKETKFWALYEQMPKNFHQDRKIATYVIEMYLSSGNITQAEKQLEQLQFIYGETSEIKNLREKVEKTTPIKQPIEKPSVQRSTESNALNSREIRHLLLELLQKGNSSIAEIMVNEEEFHRLNDKTMTDMHEVQVLSMVCYALKTLQNYSVNLLHDLDVSSEDAYNRTLKLFFNLREEQFLGYRLDEQTQGGTTNTIYRSGEHGVGRRDLLLIRKTSAVALLEGIKLDGLREKKIEEHIEKLRNYNIERVPLVIMPIYGHMPNEKEFWERYEKLLLGLQQNRSYDITAVEKMDDFLKTEFSAGLQYIIRTRHSYQEFEVTVYHIMINIKGV